MRVVPAVKAVAIVLVALVSFLVGRYSVTSKQNGQELVRKYPDANGKALACAESSPPAPREVSRPRAGVSFAQKVNDSKSSLARELIDNAADLIARGKTKEAIAQVDAALESAPDNSQLLMDSAEFYLKVVQNPTKAAELYQRADQLRPGDLRAFNGLVESVYSMTDKNAALETLKRASESSPNPFESNLALGDLYMQMGKPAEAAQAFEGARQVGDSDPQVHDRLAKLYGSQGQPLKAAEEYAQAERLVDQNIQKLKDNDLEAPRMAQDKVDFRASRVNALIAAGKTSEASELFKEIKGQYDPATGDSIQEKINQKIAHGGQASDQPQKGRGE